MMARAVALMLAGVLYCVHVPAAHSQALDPDGVAMLFESAHGASYRLQADDPNASHRFKVEKGSAAVAVEGPLHYWTTAAHALDYASGGEGLTARLHVYASGG